MSYDDVFELREGLRSGERFYWDGAGLTRQLGVDTIVASNAETGS